MRNTRNHSPLAWHQHLNLVEPRKAFTTTGFANVLNSLILQHLLRLNPSNYGAKSWQRVPPIRCDLFR